MASLSIAQRLLSHDLWRVVVWYKGELTAAVVDQATLRIRVRVRVRVRVRARVSVSVGLR